MARSSIFPLLDHDTDEGNDSRCASWPNGGSFGRSGCYGRTRGLPPEGFRLLRPSKLVFLVLPTFLLLTVVPVPGRLGTLVNPFQMEIRPLTCYVPDWLKCM
jgi:hypothetical protein